MRLKLWKMNPIVLPRSCANCDSVSEAILFFWRVTLPLVGVSREPTMFMAVDFPDPEGPMMAMNSPSLMSMEIPSRALTVLSPMW